MAGKLRGYYFRLATVNQRSGAMSTSPPVLPIGLLLGSVCLLPMEGSAQSVGCLQGYSLFSDQQTILRDPDSFASGKSGSNGYTELGIDGKSHGEMVSKGNVLLKDRARVFANVTAGGSVTLLSGAQVTGTIRRNASVPTCALPQATVSIGIRNINATAGAALDLAPGVYRDARVDGNGLLKLRTGAYHFRSLRVDAGGRFEFNPATGNIEVYVDASLSIGDRSQFNFKGFSLPERVKFHTQQTTTLTVGTDVSFRGTLVAPSAQVKAFSRTQFRGAVYAKSIDFEPDVRVFHAPFSFSVACADFQMYSQAGTYLLAGSAALGDVGSDTYVEIGDSAIVNGNLFSVGNAKLKPFAMANGNVIVGGTLSRSVGDSVTGFIRQNQQVPSCPIAAQQVIGGSQDFVVGPSQENSLDPGSYGTVRINTDGILNLRTGKYSFKYLILDAGATVNTDAASGSVRVGVANEFRVGDNAVFNSTVPMARDSLAYAAEDSVPGILVPYAVAIPMDSSGLEIYTAQTLALRIGSQSLVSASLTAPNATVTLAAGSKLEGRLRANRIYLEGGSGFREGIVRKRELVFDSLLYQSDGANSADIFEADDFRQASYLLSGSSGGASIVGDWEGFLAKVDAFETATQNRNGLLTLVSKANFISIEPGARAESKTFHMAAFSRDTVFGNGATLIANPSLHFTDDPVSRIILNINGQDHTLVPPREIPITFSGPGEKVITARVYYASGFVGSNRFRIFVK